MNDREKLRHRFKRAFARWEIELPVDAMSHEEVSRQGQFQPVCMEIRLMHGW